MLPVTTSSSRITTDEGINVLGIETIDPAPAFRRNRVQKIAGMMRCPDRPLLIRRSRFRIQVGEPTSLRKQSGPSQR
ncbi:MAG: hypothetical protein ACK55I_42870, partial [bacterium]